MLRRLVCHFREDAACQLGIYISQDDNEGSVVKKRTKNDVFSLLVVHQLPGQELAGKEPLGR